MLLFGIADHTPPLFFHLEDGSSANTEGIYFVCNFLPDFSFVFVSKSGGELAFYHV